jgi:type IV pilus assembly protein PilB
MMMSSKVRELSFKGAGTQEIRKAAIAAGMHTLYQDGIAKVMKGVTSLEEVYRIAKRTD